MADNASKTKQASTYKGYNNIIAVRIRELMKSSGTTQQELAEALNTTQQSIARYESGERKADQNTLFALANYFKISINDFFPPINSVENRKDEMDLLESTLKKKGFLNENEDLSEENYNRLINFVKANKSFIMKNEDDNK